MKNLTLMALLLISITHSSMANPKNSDKVSAQLSITSSASNQKKATVRISNLVEGRKSFLKIKDKRGHLLHAETIHDQSSFVRTYDFSNLKGEEYIVEVRTKEGTTSQTFQLKTEQEKSTYFKPVIRTETDMIKVVFQNPTDAPLSLNLYDESGQVIYKTKVLSQEVFATGLDVSRLKHKQYSLRIRGVNYSYSKNISMR